MTGVKLKVNGEDRIVLAGATVATLVEALGCGWRGVAVAVNEDVVPRSAWARTPLGGGDRVEILHAAQGG